MEQLLTQQRRRGGGLSELMPINVFEEDGAVVIEASLPGIQPNQVDVSHAGNVLTIHARSEVPDRDYLHQELHSVEYQRQISLPEDCRFEEAEAEVDQGILSVRIPQTRSQAQERVRIQVTRRGPAAQTIEAEPGSLGQARRRHLKDKD
jgi:HSP20 family protein